MNAQNLEVSKWIDDLSRFTERNHARRMDIEVFTDDFGAQPEARQLKLRGATFDPHDRRVDIMVAGPGESHLTHSIGNVKNVQILVAPRGPGDILSIQHDGGRTIVRPSIPPSQVETGNACVVDL